MNLIMLELSLTCQILKVLELESGLVKFHILAFGSPLIFRVSVHGPCNRHCLKRNYNV